MPAWKIIIFLWCLILEYQIKHSFTFLLKKVCMFRETACLNWQANIFKSRSLFAESERSRRQTKLTYIPARSLIQESFFAFYIKSKNEFNIGVKNFTTIKLVKMIVINNRPSNLSANRGDNFCAPDEKTKVIFLWCLN